MSSPREYLQGRRQQFRDWRERQNTDRAQEPRHRHSQPGTLRSRERARTQRAEDALRNRATPAPRQPDRERLVPARQERGGTDRQRERAERFQRASRPLADRLRAQERQEQGASHRG